MENRTLHLLKDDKFIDQFIYDLKKVDNIQNHNFISYDQKDNKKFKYISSGEIVHKPIKNLLDEVSNYKNLIVHNLTDELWPVFQKLDKNTKIYWIVFGADFYHITKINLYQPHTNHYLYKIGGKRYFPKIFIDFKQNIFWYIKNRKKISMIKRVNYILHYNYFEIDLIKRITATQASCLEFMFGKFTNLMNSNYDYNQNVMNELFNKNIINSILIGNSGNPTNNHLEAFINISKNKRFKSYYIITPLSYGNREYISFIIKIGKNLFGDRFLPVTNFISLNNYYSLLKTVNFAVYNHNRGQAGGNILPLIWFGKTIFMQEENYLFKYLESIGVKSLYEIDSLNNYKEKPNEFINHNQKILLSKFSSQVLNYNMTNIVKELNS